ncbi:aldo/keto reductase [Neisseria perflava]|uniref:aldo/keto reductase n=1 Tax=Neisseria perflava TaxID=33053 RepID=UPI00209FCD50|nr:aldo/keto reductase [Neisseria perflava]MCP1661321.1 diketogulonate reductase-like aldo/keto reductase [Neisseria perflava]MCP1773262.1 diketogulonate reductase-like aldo/keto reductase [Neisseria perflava]
MDYLTLSNGVKMPQLSYGVFQVPPEDAEHLVLDAINVGYRHIDTAQAYWNEEGVGNAIKKCALPREELFITTKVWISNAGYEKAAASIDESLRKLQTDYIDLLLIHQPFGDYYGTYRAMVEAYKAGKIRAIGVSNFSADRFIDIAHFAEIPPMMNQIEGHVFSQRADVRPTLAKYNCVMTAWAPFAEGQNGIFSHPVLTRIGSKYGKTAGQVALRFLLQNGIVAIPKSSRKERMAENFAVFDFALNEDEMQQIKALDTGKPLIADLQDPTFVEMLFANYKL